jgi:glycosyltransferase involved in cell wall biosynthesis
MTRVALLPSAYPPALGGVEELTRHLALALVDAGDEVEVWTLHGDDSRPETVEVRDGLIVRRLPMPLPAAKWSSLYRSATIGPRTLFSLRNAIDAFRPDVLHVVCFGPNGAYANLASRLAGLPLIITLQGETVMDDSDIFQTSRTLKSALRKGIRSAAVVTGCSAFTLADAELRFGLEPGRGLVIPNGVDVAGIHTGTESASAGQGADARPPDASASGLVPEGSVGVDPPEGRYILALGRVVEKKGFDLLLAAYAGMDQSRGPVDLVIGGSGPALEGLKASATNFGIADRVHFPGRLNRSQVARFMSRAELFVMPSRLEPFGIVVLEGWRAGVAVVATTRGGPPEFVRNGVDGVLVDPFDTPAFTSALDGLVSDDEFRRAVAAAGRARVDEFAWPVIAERYRTVYSSVVRKQGSGRQFDHAFSPPHGESVS